MGPPESATSRAGNQDGRRRRLPHRPRLRCCLLKGCDQRFRPHRARGRYCSDHCREAARQWSRWKAQDRYRKTLAGRQKRNGQSQRCRKRIQSRKPPEPEAVDEATRVISSEELFRSFVRPARLLREVRAPAPKSFAALMLAPVPACNGACSGAGAALESGARLNPNILIRPLALAYIQPV
jgi:hypothetical protein